MYIVDDYVKEKETTIKIVMLKDFSKELDYIIKKYEEANPKESKKEKV